MTDKVTEIREWMRAVMEVRGWSAQRWADMAGISGSTITRFLSGASPFVPSTTTINKLSQVAGIAPTSYNSAYVTLKLADWSGISYNGRQWNVVQSIGEIAVMSVTGDFVLVVDISYAMPRIMAADKVVVKRCRAYDLQDGAWAAYMEADRVAVARVVAGRMISLDGESVEQPRPEKVIGTITQVIADLG